MPTGRVWERETETYLGEAAEEGEERERVCAVRERKRREDGELRADPDDAEPDRERDLAADVHRARGGLVEEREDAEAGDHERPADVVLRAVAADDLHGHAADDGEDGDHDAEDDHVDAGADRGG